MKQVKNKMSNYLKLGIFLFAISFSLWNCKKDEVLPIEENTFRIGDFQITRKNFNELSDTNPAKLKITKLQTNRFENNATGITDIDFTIDTSNFIQITNSTGAIISYKFDVILDTPIENTVTTLMIDVNNEENTVIAKLIKAKYPEGKSGLNITPELTARVLDITEEELTTITTASRVETDCYPMAIAVEHRCTAGGLHSLEDIDRCKGDPDELPGYHIEYIDICYDNFNSSGSPASDSVAAVLGSNGSIGGTGGFDQYEDLMNFRNFMGWGNLPEDDPKFAWWVNANNSKITNLIAFMYLNSTSGVAQNQIDTIISQAMASGFNNSDFQQQTFIDLQTYIFINNFSSEDCQFVVEALKAISNGGSVDIADKVTSKLTGKEKCLFDHLLENFNNGDGNSFINNILNEFNGDGTEFNIKIKSADHVYSSTTGYEINGKTHWSSTSNEIIITINTSLAATRPALGVTGTILHELIHADMFRKLHSNDPSFVDEEFLNTYNSFEDNLFQATPQHNTMAALYVNNLKDALKDYHRLILVGDYNYLTNNGTDPLPDDFYEALAWMGLKVDGVEAYTNLTAARKAELDAALALYYHTTTTNCP